MLKCCKAQMLQKFKWVTWGTFSKDMSNHFFMQDEE